MSRKLASILLVPVVTAVLVMGSLSGCAPATTGNALSHKGSSKGGASSSPVATPTQTPTPTPTGPPPLPANALFQISATVTAPGGASANLVQTVFVPAVATPANRTVLDGQCESLGNPNLGGTKPWADTYVGTLILSSTMTATLNPGSSAWDNKANPVLADFLGFGAFTGAYAGFEAACSPGFITIPGTQQAIGPIQAANPSGQPYGWAGEFGGYGFYGGANDPGAPDLGGSAVVSNCVVQLSGTATANATAAAWATFVPKLIDGCDYSGAKLP